MTDLQAQIDELRSEIARLREELATEVHTRKVVVVGPDGFKRIELDAWDQGASVTVTGRGETMDPPVIMLHVGEENLPGPMAAIMMTPLDGALGGDVVITTGPRPEPEMAPKTLHVVQELGDNWIPGRHRPIG